MKKMMMMIAGIALCAVFAQAATVDWGTDGFGYFNTTKLNASTAKATGYLLAFEGGSVSAEMINGLYGEWKGGPVTVVDVAGPATSSALGKVGGSYIVGDGEALGATGLTMTENTTYFASIFFITQGGADYYYLGSSVLYDKASPAWDNPGSKLNVKQAMPSGTPWTPIPEPTSMALVALGVATLGLRRKFRA